MTITIRQQVDAADNSANIPIALGAGTAVGDLVVAFSADDFYLASDITAPSSDVGISWTLQHTLDGGTDDNHCKVWTAPVTTGGAHNLTFGNAAHLDHERYAGAFVLQDSPQFDTADSTDSDSSSTSHVAPSLNPTAGKTDDLLLCLFGTSFEAAAINYTGMPAGMTAYTERDIGNTTFRAASEQLTSDAATGTRTATASATRVWFAVSVLIKSAGAPAVAGGMIVQAAQAFSAF